MTQYELPDGFEGMAGMTDVPNGNMELKAVSIAQCAVLQADALIAELNKEQGV